MVPITPAQLEVTDKVKVAAKALDEKFDDWARKVNVHKLQMTHFENCIIGQVCGWGNAPDIQELPGFMGDVKVDNAPLIKIYTDCWKKEIQSRV